MNMHRVVAGSVLLVGSPAVAEDGRDEPKLHADVGPRTHAISDLLDGRGGDLVDVDELHLLAVDGGEGAQVADETPDSCERFFAGAHHVAELPQQRGLAAVLALRHDPEGGLEVH